MELNYFIK